MRPDQSGVRVLHPHDPDVPQRQIAQEIAIFLRAELEPGHLEDHRLRGEEGRRADEPGVERREPVGDRLRRFEHEGEQRPGSEIQRLGGGGMRVHFAVPLLFR